uniref:Uncharacterized protein n=1 Tax=Heterorhabditis bacteriophora TaxID=37862 RepID=A0A1I7WW15_HETBA
MNDLRKAVHCEGMKNVVSTWYKQERILRMIGLMNIPEFLYQGLFNDNLFFNYKLI